MFNVHLGREQPAGEVIHDRPRSDGQDKPGIVHVHGRLADGTGPDGARDARDDDDDAGHPGGVRARVEALGVVVRGRRVGPVEGGHVEVALADDPGALDVDTGNFCDTLLIVGRIKALR